jgi:hypothetical protein
VVLAPDPAYDVVMNLTDALDSGTIQFQIPPDQGVPFRPSRFGKKNIPPWRVRRSDADQEGRGTS